MNINYLLLIHAWCMECKYNIDKNILNYENTILFNIYYEYDI